MMDRTDPDSWCDPEKWPLAADRPLPDWVTEIRAPQAEALAAISRAYLEGGPESAGTKLVVLDAPTGAGKSLIGEGARRMIAEQLAGMKSLYVCHNIDLQQQFIRDFPYARLLKGRANYSTQHGPWPQITCADCDDPTGQDCSWCEGPAYCGYRIAKRQALASPLAVVNTAYMLAEANNVDEGVSRRSFIVADECDTLEALLLGYVEFRVSGRMAATLGMREPIKGARKPTLIKWLQDFATVAGMYQSNDKKRVEAVKRAGQQATMVAGALAGDAEDENEGKWIRAYDDMAALILQPVLVAPFGVPNLWQHGTRWLAMSGTVVSSDELVTTLGWQGDYETITVPMSFPVENRPVIIAGVANVIHKEMDDAYPRLAYAIEKILALHPDDRVLVHTVSYKLADELKKRVNTRRPKYTYANARDKEFAVQQYRARQGAVMFAPSLDRGVDFKDDDCRVQVIAKVPFPNLGDRRTSARMHLPGGNMWYRVQTVRTVMQMTGRAVRSKDDYATTYILDKQFGSNLYDGPGKMLFPKWWRDGISRTFNARELRMP